MTKARIASSLAPVGPQLRFQIASALLIGLCHQSASAQDAAREQARSHFTAGVDAYEAGNYQQALEAFEAAYRIAPHPTVQVNIANCHERLGNPQQALRHFELFLQQSLHAPATRRQEVRQAVERLRHASPGNGVEEAPGSAATASQPNPVLPDGAVATADAGPPLQQEEGWPASVRPGTWVAASVTLATTLSAVVVGLLASSANSDFEDSHRAAQNPSNGPTSRLLAYSQSIEDADRANDLALVTDILGVVAAVGAGTTAVLLILDLGRDQEDPAFAITPSLDPLRGQAGVSASLSF